MNKNYEEFKRLASLTKEEIEEHEENVKMHFIVPFLHALGHKNLSYESERSDILLKRDLPEDCTVLIECKKYDKDLSDCVEQLKGYWHDKHSLIAMLINGEEMWIYSPSWRGKKFENTLIYRFKREQLSEKETVDTLFKILSHEALIDKSAMKFVDEREKYIDDKKESFENEIKELEKQKQELEEEIKSTNKKIEFVNSAIWKKTEEMRKEVPQIDAKPQSIVSDKKLNEGKTRYGIYIYDNFLEEISKKVRELLPEKLQGFKNTVGHGKKEQWMRYHWRGTDVHVGVDIYRDDEGDGVTVYLLNYKRDPKLNVILKENEQNIKNTLHLDSENPDAFLSDTRDVINKWVDYIKEDNKASLVGKTAEEVANFIKVLKPLLGKLL